MNEIQKRSFEDKESDECNYINGRRKDIGRKLYFNVILIIRIHFKNLVTDLERTYIKQTL